MTNVPELFGSMVFNESVMQEKLPKETYKALKKTIKDGKELDISIANVVANAMKDWAIEHGATHFTHWFQPLTGITAEKHDSFITPVSDGGIIMDFSGKELIKGEPDASSFPSGGLRATFEARGYTAWDPTSYAFLKDGSLCIPTAFCSYTGEALDKKTPLLRSMEAIYRQALRVLRVLGDKTTKTVNTTVGAEPEYFLIDKKDYKARKDLIFTGRTLFGAMPPKGQEMDDHYFGAIKPRVSAFMKELDASLWELGIPSKTKHNEVAPTQHEMAPIFETTNIATDHNQLTMELMKKIADKHDLACLLHEKPFDGINGSGKHNNWSISTDGGDNLLKPTDCPEKNTRFLLFLCAIIKAVDEYQDLLRVAVSSAGNDHRLGANEAPPAIISMFLGDELEKVIESIDEGKEYTKEELSKMVLGAKVIPQFTKDNTDRNRTSPFAFTGNKFEFRSLGSTASIADTNIVLNTIVADELEQIADFLESVDDIDDNIMNILLQNVVKQHKRVIFNGNSYSEEWVNEAKKRGLLNLKTTVDALPYILKEKNIRLFERQHVFTKDEIFSRYEIMLENYNKTINIETLTMIEMLNQDIIPAVVNYSNDLCVCALNKEAVGIKNATEKTIACKISDLLADVYSGLDSLKEYVCEAKKIDDALNLSEYYRDSIIPKMEEIRVSVDMLEEICGADYWPYPTYSDMLFYAN